MTDRLTISLATNAALAFVVSVLLAPPLLWFLRHHRVIDVPSERSSHRAPTPRAGGLAPAAGCLVAGFLGGHTGGETGAALVVVGVEMAAIGILDDLRGLAVLPRLVIQVVVAGAGAAWLTGTITGSLAWRAAFFVGVVAWVTGYVNAFNFMDGINGMSVAQVLVAGGAWWAIGTGQHVPVLAAAGALSAAAAAGFAPFNVPRALMFLGDTGSYFFGGWLAVAAAIGIRAHLPPEAVAAPLAIYGADTCATLVRRMARHEAWYRPHRDHAYQRLVLAGWSHTRTSVVVGAAMVAVSGFGALSLTGSVAVRVAGDMAAVGVVAAYLASPSLIGRRRAATASGT